MPISSGIAVGLIDGAIGARPTTPFAGQVYVADDGHWYLALAAGVWTDMGTGGGGGGATSVSNSDGTLTISPTTGAVVASLALGHVNTWTAIQTVQGLTTTSPGWYAQITGDAVPRVRVGVNANDAASIGFGSGAATRDLFIERVAAATVRWGGTAVDTAPVAQIDTVQNTLAGGTSNVAGANRTFAGSQGKGIGVGGSIIFQVAPAGSTGTAVNALATALTIASDKSATFAGVLAVVNSSQASATFSGSNNNFSGITITNTQPGANSWNLAATGSSVDNNGFQILSGSTPRLSFAATGVVTVNTGKLLLNTTGLFENAATVLEINNGTAGQWGALKLGTRDSGTTTVTNGLTIGHQSTGTSAAGLGSAVLLNIDSSTTPDRNAARFQGKWTIATDASRTSQIDFQTVTNAGALTTGLSVNQGAALLVSYTVATLPSASGAGAGALAFITDSTTTAITGLGLAPVGSGSNKVVVYSDGTQWLIL